MMLLDTLLGNHRLHRAAKLGVVALASRANQVDEQVRTGHGAE
jgi:hypothetical protein